MARDAMTQSSDSSNPVAPQDTPLYAVVRRGKFYLLDVQDAPCLTLSADGLNEIENADRLPMDDLPQIEIKAAPPCGPDYGDF